MKKDIQIEMIFNFNDSTIKENIFYGEFGLEKESLRTTVDGFLSDTAHPFEDDPHIQRDFCENQTELITDVYYSAEDVWKGLKTLNEKVAIVLSELKSGEEVLWPFSNPPYVKDESEINIADYTGILKSKKQYREYLAEKYGKKKMLYSGIHFNFSFAEEALKENYKYTCRKNPDISYRDYKDGIYLHLARMVMKTGWIIVYLTAASPVMDGSFFSAENMGNVVMKNYSSFRCSDIGYWNDFMPLLEYSSLNEYIDDIQKYVDEGQIIAPAELYYPVRLKPKGENTLENLKKSGVNHIEIRVLDLNPLSEVGIMKEDIEFLHIMMVYLMYSECDEFSHSEQIAAIKNLKRAAEYDDEKIVIETGWNSGKPIKSAALEFIDDVEAFCRRFSSPYSADCIEYQRDKIVHSQNRYAVRIRKMFGENYVQRGLRLSQNYVKAIKEARGNV